MGGRGVRQYGTRRLSLPQQQRQTGGARACPPARGARHPRPGRLAEARPRLAALIGGGQLPPETAAALRLLEIANLLALGEADGAADKLGGLAALVAAQPEGFAVGWTFAGTVRFVGQAPTLAEHREMLLGLIQAMATCDRETGLDAIAAARNAVAAWRAQ